MSTLTRDELVAKIQRLHKLEQQYRSATTTLRTRDRHIAAQVDADGLTELTISPLGYREHSLPTLAQAIVDLDQTAKREILSPWIADTAAVSTTLLNYPITHTGRSAQRANRAHLGDATTSSKGASAASDDKMVAITVDTAGRLSSIHLHSNIRQHYRATRLADTILALRQHARTEQAEHRNAIGAELVKNEAAHTGSEASP